MFKRLYLLILGALLVVPTMAQDDPSSPRAAVDAALTAVETQVGTRASNFRFQFLGDVADSSLGCPLVAGEELPYTLNTVLVSVIYPDAQYTVYTSISGQVVILCDAQFGDEVLASQIDSETACTATPIQALPAYEAPNITLDGVFTAGVQEYPVYGASSDGGWYQIASELGLGWIEATSVTISGDCTNVPTTSITNPVADGVCFVTTQAGFTNVRSTPEGDLVGRIYENESYQITARNTQATWFYIQPAGWVSNTVIFQLGDCNNITVNDNAVGVGFVTEDGTQDTDAAVILERFACPADFAGYLVPRIATGQGTAQVTAGTIPNTLRGFPSVDDAEAPRIGVIQPQRVIDRVIAGPACNQGFVWWLVEIDGTVGWTAESNQSSNDYFLEPTGDAPASATEPLSVSENPVLEMVYSADGSRLFAHSTEQGFGDGELGVVIVFDTTNNSSLARIEEPSGIVDIAKAVDADDIAVAAGNGIVTLYDMQTLEQSAQVVEAFSVANDGTRIAITPDASSLVVAQCDTDACESSLIRVINVADGNILAAVSVDAAVIDLNLSENGQVLAVVLPQGISFHTPTTLAETSLWENTDGFDLTSVDLTSTGETAYFSGCNNVTCDQGRIGLVTIADGSLLGVVASHSTDANYLTLNSDETRFVTGGSQMTEIIERNAATGDATETLAASTSMSALAYAPDGRVLAVGTIDGQIIFLPLSE